tara:strand:- start:934 stop:1920 length:987 start_codon:yes stop_codon:yes gene_type:complete
MLVDKAGELIADVMTMSRSLASIPSASAILDTSNYTFHAISYGKDASGFLNHAHTIFSPSSNNVIKVVHYGTLSLSAYQTSTTARTLSATYSQLPQSPTPIDVRLERNSTVPNYSSGVPNVGHCINSIISPSLSSFANLIGCYPASGGTTYWVLSSTTATRALYSGTIIGDYNKNSLMDISGFLTFANLTCAQANTASGNKQHTSGALRTLPSTFPKDVTINWGLPSGDAGGLLLFGGIYHIGLWCLDIKEMLKAGYSPPYSFNPLNNIRKYRLFSKLTFNRDVLYLVDGDDGFGTIYPGFNTYFGSTGAWGGVSPKEIIFNWSIGFA